MQVDKRILSEIYLPYTQPSCGSVGLGCSRYNWSDKGLLLIDFTGVIEGQCCHCFVSVGIHATPSLLPPCGIDQK